MLCLGVSVVIALGDVIVCQHILRRHGWKRRESWQQDRAVADDSESSTVKQQAKQHTSETKTTPKISKRRIKVRKQPDRLVREKTEQVKLSKGLKGQPLDVQQLKSIAELAKKIQNRPKQK